MEVVDIYTTQFSSDTFTDIIGHRYFVVQRIVKMIHIKLKIIFLKDKTKGIQKNIFCNKSK